MTRGRPVAVPRTCWRRSRFDALNNNGVFGLKYACRREIAAPRRLKSDALICNRAFDLDVVVGSRSQRPSPARAFLGLGRSDALKYIRVFECDAKDTPRLEVVRFDLRSTSVHFDGFMTRNVVH